MRFARFIRFFRHLSWMTLRETAIRVGQRRLTGLSAEMAYNAMLALFPAILAILTAIGLFEVVQAPIQQLGDRLGEVAPTEALFLIDEFIKEVSQSQNQGLFSISFVAAIWTASGAMSAAMTALDQIHQIPLDQVRPFWKSKLISIALTLGSILLLITASLLIVISDLTVQLVAEQIQGLARIILAVWRLLSWPIALGIVASAFAFIYRYGPSRWRHGTPILPGAMIAAVFWAVLSSLFRLYVTNFGNYNKAYGAVGTVIVLMLWLYLSSLVILVGDQLNATVGEAMEKKRTDASLEVSEVSQGRKN